MQLEAHSCLSMRSHLLPCFPCMQGMGAAGAGGSGGAASGGFGFGGAQGDGVDGAYDEDFYQLGIDIFQRLQVRRA